jgi:alpha-glucosidase
MLEFYRAALAFRRAHPVLRYGDMTGITAEGPVIRFTRQGAEEIFCAFNLGEASQDIHLPDGRWEAIGGALGAQPVIEGKANLGPWHYCLARRV